MWPRSCFELAAIKPWPSCLYWGPEGGVDGNTLAHSGVQGLLGATFSDWHFHFKDQWCIKTPILINQKWNPYLTDYDKNHWFKNLKTNGKVISWNPPKTCAAVVPIGSCCSSLTIKNDFFFLLLKLAYNLISRSFQGCALNRSKMKIFQGLIRQPLQKKTLAICGVIG